MLKVDTHSKFHVILRCFLVDLSEEIEKGARIILFIVFLESKLQCFIQEGVCQFLISVPNQ